MEINTDKIFKGIGNLFVGNNKSSNILDNEVQEIIRSINKEKLCKLLNIDADEVNWIQYDWRQQKLIIKSKPKSI